MSTDELITLFNTELERDIPTLSVYIDNASTSEIKALAHKYKVRLHYLGYMELYERCLEIERHYNEKDHIKLIECARRLRNGLLSIQNN